MLKYQGKNQNILVTGGTSGLGLELVHLFLKEGYNVVATGRQQISLHGFEEKFTLYIVDFSDLKQVACEAGKISRNHSFSFIVNNAGILSPPKYTETIDGLEYTFQINFLAHLLINTIILGGINDNQPIRIASVTSPVYRFAELSHMIKTGSKDYRSMRSYSSSKLCVAMMGELLAPRFQDLNLQCFSFDPGTFSSGIYRMQNKWFRYLYHIAAPFMRSPAMAAKSLAELITKGDFINGMIYDTSKRQRSLPAMDDSQKDSFINSCYALIDPLLNLLPG